MERLAKAMADDLSKRYYGIDCGPEDTWEAQTDYSREEWRHAARAAIAALPSTGIDELVEALAEAELGLDAAARTINGGDDSLDALQIVRAKIAARAALSTIGGEATAEPNS